MAVRPVVAPGPSSTPFSPAIPPSHPTTTFVLGDFLARAPLADPPSVPTPPPIPAPTTTPATGNAWLDRARAAALQSRQAQQGVGKQAPQAQRPQTRLPQAELPQQLSQGSDEAEDVASFASGDEDCAWSSASHSICSSSGGSSTPGATTCTALGSLSPTASLLASPANPGSPLPSPSLAKQLAQGLNEKTVTLSTGFGAPAATLDQAIDVSSSPATSIAAIRNLICSGQLAWLAPVATELQHVMTAAAGGGQVLFCTLTSGADGSTMPPGDAADPIVAVQPVFELSVTPVGLSGCGTADLSQALGVKVVRDPRTLACYNPEDCFGPGCSLVSFEVVLPAAGAHVSGLKGAAAQPVVAQGVPIRRSQILAAAGVATGSEEAAAATAAALPSTQCQLTARAQSFQSESDDELALELARLCGCNC
ncbi:hypothetical protein HXX76_015969 [Chlamydomonas incerta]|uniref:Uncharacterized protein n=1 Tax=Chlamydomonas incerta TaxID=51695 RepID=A0A835VP37_CHLIN|nr:hypothetical protein HXX76_015969 [Chlamydomonas incerta]|eukprot:KAG2422500.1 hypothetical protein HXX76_015969 [Chlamydomonas incerta]